jgi:hypothetical protein
MCTGTSDMMETLWMAWERGAPGAMPNADPLLTESSCREEGVLADGEVTEMGDGADGVSMAGIARRHLLWHSNHTTQVI